MSSDTRLTEPFNTLYTKPISFCIVLTACTHLIRLFYCTAGNLSSVLHKKIIYDVSLCTFLAANWTSNDSNLGGERRGAAARRAGRGHGRRGLGRAQQRRGEHEVALGRGQAALAEGVQAGQQLGRPALDVLVAHGASVQQVEPGRLASALRVGALPTLGLVLPTRRRRGPPGGRRRSRRGRRRRLLHSHLHCPAPAAAAAAEGGARSPPAAAPDDLLLLLLLLLTGRSGDPREREGEREGRAEEASSGPGDPPPGWRGRKKGICQRGPFQIGRAHV